MPPLESEIYIPLAGFASAALIVLAKKVDNLFGQILADNHAMREMSAALQELHREIQESKAERAHIGAQLEQAKAERQTLLALLSAAAQSSAAKSLPPPPAAE